MQCCFIESQVFCLFFFWRSVYIPPVQAADRILPGFLGSISHSFMWCRASAALSVATQHWYRYTCNCCKLQHLHMRAPEETVLFQQGQLWLEGQYVTPPSFSREEAQMGLSFIGDKGQKKAVSRLETTCWLSQRLQQGVALLLTPQKTT